MKSRLIFLPSLVAIAIAAIAGLLNQPVASQADLSINEGVEPVGLSASIRETASMRKTRSERYKLAPGQSQFMVEAYSGGLLWFMGHTHHFAIRNFTGEAEATVETLEPGSLHLTVRADSLEETGKDFTEEQKKIINEGARKEVLQVADYPEIIFKSSNVKSEKLSDGQFKTEIGGDLTLHGVTHRIVIPARVTISRDTLRASGEFSINRSDYGVKTHAVKGGLVRVRDRVKFTFDITANKF